jgi:signal transduction histidine kinase
MEIKRMLNAEKTTADIPFVFLSAAADPALKTSGLSLGAEDYITKSVDILELIARIQAILRRKEKVDLQARQEFQQILENLSSSLPVHTSHYFRATMGVLLLSLEMLAKKQAPTGQYLLYARNSAYRMKAWMETLIWLNEFDLGKSAISGEQLDLEYSFILPIKEVFDLWVEKMLQLNFKIDEGLTLHTPARAFTLAVCHLIDNACKFSPPGGLIQVCLQSDGFGENILTVEDQGPGIPLEMRATVFERFSQLADEQSLPENHGLGLGLFMARSFARSQGGEVCIFDSAPGCGVQMTLMNTA